MAKIVHFYKNSTTSVCGGWWDQNKDTTDKDEVTCKKCLKLMYCACGHPQSYPIPHEHSQTDREKVIIKHFEDQLINQDNILDALKDFDTALIEGNKPVDINIKGCRAPAARHSRLMIAIGKMVAALEMNKETDGD